MFFPSRARLASCSSPMHRRRNLANSVVSTLLERRSRLAFHATMCRAEDNLEPRWNRILTIFDPYTFSHSQGQRQKKNPAVLELRPRPFDPQLRTSAAGSNAPGHAISENPDLWMLDQIVQTSSRLSGEHPR